MLCFPNAVCIGTKHWLFSCLKLDFLLLDENLMLCILLASKVLLDYS